MTRRWKFQLQECRARYYAFCDWIWPRILVVLGVGGGAWLLYLFVTQSLLPGLQYAGNSSWDWFLPADSRCQVELYDRWLRNTSFLGMAVLTTLNVILGMALVLGVVVGAVWSVLEGPAYVCAAWHLWRKRPRA